MEINSSKKARDNMTESEAKGFIQGKLNCMKKCGVFNKEDNINYNDCDYCHYCYSQGNFGQQKEAFSVAIKALEKQIQMERYCDENGCADCPYHNPTLKDNRCMNDFIIDKE